MSYHVQCSWIIISFYAGNQSGYIGLNVCFSSDLVKTRTENNILVHEENSHSDEKLKKNFSGNSSLKSVNSQNKRLYIARVFSPLNVLSSESISCDGLRFKTFIKSAIVVMD